MENRESPVTGNSFIASCQDFCVPIFPRSCDTLPEDSVVPNISHDTCQQRCFSLHECPRPSHAVLHAGSSCFFINKKRKHTGSYVTYSSQSAYSYVCEIAECIALVLFHRGKEFLHYQVISCASPVK